MTSKKEPFTAIERTNALIGELQDELFRGPMQHLRSWHDIDRLHDRAVAEIRRLIDEVAFLRGPV